MALLEQTSGPSNMRFGNGQRTYSTLTGDHYAKLRQLVTSRFQASEAHLRSRFEKFYRYEKLIHMVTKKRQYDWKANAFLPYAYSMSEQAAAIKWLALFMTRPYVTVQPRRAAAELNDVALRRQGLIDWRLTGDLDIVSLGADMFRQAERYGKSVACIGPAWDKQVVPYRGVDQLPLVSGSAVRMEWKQRTDLGYRLQAKAMDLVDFRPEPGKRRVNGPEGMRWVGRQYWMTLDELRQLEQTQQIGPSVGGQSVEEITDTDVPNTDDYKLRRMLLRNMDDIERYIDPFDRAVRLSELQTWIPREAIDPKIAEMEAADGLNPYKRIIILANDRIVLQDTALPWDHGQWGFIDMDCVPDPHDFWGKGSVEPVEHLNYAGNEILNMRLDNVKQAVNALMGVAFDRLPAGARERMILQPYGIVDTGNEDPNLVIQRIPLGDVTASSYQEQTQLWTLMQEARGINETMMGAPGPERTLGEHVLKAESSSKRIQFELVSSAAQLLGWNGGLSRFIIGLDRQYLPIPSYVAVADPERPDEMMTLEVAARSLAMEDQLFAYLPTGATEGINIQSKRADLAAMLQALAPFGPVMGQLGFNFSEMVKTILKVFGYDPNKYFPKISGPMDMAQMAQGAGGGIPGQPGAMPGQVPTGGVMPGQGAGMSTFPGGGGGATPINPAILEALERIRGREAA